MKITVSFDKVVMKLTMMMLPIIALFGDSLTQYGHGCERAFTGGAPGWGDRLQERYTRRADVINRGCTQYNTRAALDANLIPKINSQGPKPPVLFATIWFGANDSCDAIKEPEKHVQIDEYARNLAEIYNRVSVLTDKIIFITPPPIRADRYRAWRAPQVKNQSAVDDRSNNVIAKYADRCLEVAQKFNAPAINVFELFQPRLNDLISDEDGLHLTGDGDLFVFEQLMSLVEAKFPELMVIPDPVTKNCANSGSLSEGLKPIVPFWDHIDPRNYRTQLALEIDDDSDVSPASWPSRPSIVLLGDSLTQFGLGNAAWCQSAVSSPAYAGWADFLTARYARRLEVYGRGLAGYNTRWALASFERLIPSSDRRNFPIELVTIFFGANDSADAVLNARQHVSLPEFEANIEELVRRCRNEWGARRILLIGCPPVDHDKYLQYARQRPVNAGKSEDQLKDRTYDVALKYSRAMEKVARKFKLPFVDLFHILGSSFADCLSDGLHLNPKGNQILGDHVIQAIDSAWPEMKCSQDTLRKKYGFFGSACRAFPPEQPWFADLYATPDMSERPVSSSKRTKL